MHKNILNFVKISFFICVNSYVQFLFLLLLPNIFMMKTIEKIKDLNFH